jgi:antitoxin MazE
MEAPVKTRLVRIGNSRGLRLAKPLIEQMGFEDEVEMRAEDGALVIRAARPLRTGWAEAAALLAATDDRLRDEALPTRFDVEEWEWR